ncbi:alpha/beta hydrolase [Amycolatopsis deserti]|uniref:Alpha/beta hydrolase n=2 Tax=Amycolatopsis deserti TaxID=185696 RepID=A0ABQ3J791_9PSEU|nr:alpha/beta hydrolase [Amycolatopsis deserti]
MTLPHPSEVPFTRPASHHMAEPRLWTVRPVRVLDGAESYLNVKYATPVGWRPLTLDLHVPLDATGPVPVVVYAHGGSFLGGVKEMGPWAALPRHAIAVASLDYRLAGEARYPEPVEDVLAAIRWVRVHAHRYGLDATRIAGWGSSAGGYLMALAALTHRIGRPVGDHPAVSARLSAVVLHYPVTDFSRIVDDAFEPTREGLRNMVDVGSQFFGFPLASRRDVVAGAAVSRAVAAASRVPPFRISHGDADRRCGLGQSRRLHEAVLSAGGESTLEVIPGADHATAVFSSPEVVHPAVEFLRDTWSSEREGVAR